jgi:hypothetical protein
LGVRFLGTQCAQTFFILKSLWIIAWIVAWLRCCQLQFISGYVPFSMMSETRCRADDRAVGRWLRLVRFLTESCPVLKLSTHWNTVLQFGAASALTTTSWQWMSAADTPSLQKNHMVHLCPGELPSIDHGSAPLHDAIVLLKRLLPHPLLPSVGWMFSYPCHITCSMFEWLGISVHVF